MNSYSFDLFIYSVTFFLLDIYVLGIGLGARDTTLKTLTLSFKELREDCKFKE